MRQIQPKLKEGTKIDKAKIFVCTLYVCVTIRSSECPIMWFRIAENGSVNGDASASPFTAVSPLCHRGEFQHGESPFTAVTPPKRKTSPVITGHLITAHWAKFWQQVDMTCKISWYPMTSHDAQAITRCTVTWPSSLKCTQKLETLIYLFSRISNCLPLR